MFNISLLSKIMSTSRVDAHSWLHRSLFVWASDQYRYLLAFLAIFSKCVKNFSLAASRQGETKPRTICNIYAYLR